MRTESVQAPSPRKLFPFPFIRPWPCFFLGQRGYKLFEVHQHGEVLLYFRSPRFTPPEEKPAARQTPSLPPTSTTPDTVDTVAARLPLAFGCREGASQVQPAPSHARSQCGAGPLTGSGKSPGGL